MLQLNTFVLSLLLLAIVAPLSGAQDVLELELKKDLIVTVPPRNGMQFVKFNTTANVPYKLESERLEGGNSATTLSILVVKKGEKPGTRDFDEIDIRNNFIQAVEFTSEGGVYYAAVISKSRSDRLEFKLFLSSLDEEDVVLSFDGAPIPVCTGVSAPKFGVTSFALSHDAFAVACVDGTRRVSSGSFEIYSPTGSRVLQHPLVLPPGQVQASPGIVRVGDKYVLTQDYLCGDNDYYAKPREDARYPYLRCVDVSTFEAPSGVLIQNGTRKGSSLQGVNHDGLGFQIGSEFAVFWSRSYGHLPSGSPMGTFRLQSITGHLWKMNVDGSDATDNAFGGIGSPTNGGLGQFGRAVARWDYNLVEDVKIAVFSWNSAQLALRWFTQSPSDIMKNIRSTKALVIPTIPSVNITHGSLDMRITPKSDAVVVFPNGQGNSVQVTLCGETEIIKTDNLRHNGLQPQVYIVNDLILVITTNDGVGFVTGYDLSLEKIFSQPIGSLTGTTMKNPVLSYDPIFDTMAVYYVDGNDQAQVQFLFPSLPENK